jgi:predicted RNase H-like nuclease (RuvC/YqgF family)
MQPVRSRPDYTQKNSLRNVNTRTQRQNKVPTTLQTELQTKVSNLQTELQEKGNEVSNLQTELQNKSSEISNLQTELQNKSSEISNFQKKQKILQQALIIMLFFGVATAIYVYKNRPAPIEPSRVEPIIPPKIPEPIKIKPKKGNKL